MTAHHHADPARHAAPPQAPASTQTAPNAPADLPAVDTTQRFVRVIEQRPDGLVAFEFSIGWPELMVELLLPRAAFAAFCSRNNVQLLAD